MYLNPFFLVIQKPKSISSKTGLKVDTNYIHFHIRIDIEVDNQSIIILTNNFRVYT